MEKRDRQEAQRTNASSGLAKAWTRIFRRRGYRCRPTTAGGSRIVGLEVGDPNGDLNAL